MSNPIEEALAAVAELVDIEVQNEGTIVLLRPKSELGEWWIRANIGKDNGFQPYYPTIVCEPRYVADIVGGAVDEGLIVSEDY